MFRPESSSLAHCAFLLVIGGTALLVTNVSSKSQSSTWASQLSLRTLLILLDSMIRRRSARFWTCLATAIIAPYRPSRFQYLGAHVDYLLLMAGSSISCHSHLSPSYEKMPCMLVCLSVVSPFLSPYGSAEVPLIRPRTCAARHLPMRILTHYMEP